MLCSGKSTLLNALLAASLLPSTNVPETARVVKITQCKGPPSLSWQDGAQQRTVEGAARICVPPRQPVSGWPSPALAGPVLAMSSAVLGLAPGLQGSARPALS